MIVYVNGDSHSAAAEAVNPHAFAEDDGLYWGMGRRPHPDNERVSYGCELANRLDAVLVCNAESASSNDRIIRTTRDWIAQNQDALTDTFMVIQWSTWERQEWFHDGTWWQVNASGIDDVPIELQGRYRQFVCDVDWDEVTHRAHDDVWRFHQELQSLGIRHVMFNGNSSFARITHHRDWGRCYIDPYDANGTWDARLRQQGFGTVSPTSWHFGPDAHCFWAQYLLQYLGSNNLIPCDAISTD